MLKGVVGHVTSSLGNTPKKPIKPVWIGNIPHVWHFAPNSFSSLSPAQYCSHLHNTVHSFSPSPKKSTYQASINWEMISSPVTSYVYYHFCVFRLWYEVCRFELLKTFLKTVSTGQELQLDGVEIEVLNRMQYCGEKISLCLDYHNNFKGYWS